MTAVASAPLPIVELMGVPLHRITAEEAVDHIMAELAAGRGGWAITPNLDILRRLARDREYAALCAPATLRTADGMPLIWASRLQRTPLPERVAGSDLIWSLTARAAQEGRSVFFLGGNPGAARAAADRFMKDHPGLRIAGVECPPMGFEADPRHMEQLGRMLREAQPDICYVALGPPKQDRVIVRFMPDLPRTWFLGIGITFSYVSGEIHRAPRWMRRVGLEWAHRLVQEPRRLARRYLIDGVPFATRLLATSALRGLRNRPSRPETPPSSA